MLSNFIQAKAKYPPSSVTHIFNTLRLLKKIITETSYGLAFLEKELEKHGDIITVVEVPFKKAYFIRHPDYIVELLINQHLNLNQGDSSRFLKLIVGNGLLTSNGKEHHIQRKTIQPEFHRKRIESYFSIMMNETKNYLSRWQNKEGENFLNMHREMKNITLRIVTKSLFDYEYDETYHSFNNMDSVINNFIVKVSLQITGKIRSLLPLPSTLGFYYQRRKIKKLINNLIDEKLDIYEKDSTNISNDLITMLIHIHSEAKSKKEKKSARQQIYDQAMTFYLAGHDTTANALSWTWYLLAKYPEVHEKAKKEVEMVLGARALSLEDIPKLIYIKKIFKEVLRLYPPAWFLQRKAIKDFNFKEYTVKKGYSISCSPYLSQRDSRYFEDPNTFIPERWTEDFEKNLPRGAYYPFGMGARMCIGEAFAQMEATVVIAMILQNFDFNLEPKDIQIDINPKITLLPKNPISMKITNRLK